MDRVARRSPAGWNTAGQGPATDRRVAEMRENVHQQVVMIGARKTMVGMMTQPVEYEPGDRPVVVILNSGIIHRVGHHRMYVVLARMLAGAGYQVLRFDLSGIGDSEGRVDGLSPLEGALADVREAI